MKLDVHFFLALATLPFLGGAAGGQATEGPPPLEQATEQGASAMAAPLPPAQPTWTPEEQTAIQLLRSLRKKERPSDLELTASLSRAGERMVPLYFKVLAARRVPALDLGEPQILSEVQEKAILLALAQLDRDAVLRHVGAAMLAEATPALRIAAIGCIGAVGRANDLPQLFDLAFAPEEAVPEQHLARALRSAVTALLARDPRGVEQLVSLRRITRPELLTVLVEAVGATRDPRGLAYLSDIAYWHDGLVLDVMSQVPLLGPSGDEAIDGALRVRLRSYLEEDQTAPCRAAITALTALRDQDAIAPFIELLESESTGLRDTAHWGLKQLTGLALAPTAEVWARWHQGELYWLVRSMPAEFKRLRENDPAQVADALRSILSHPLARAELASALPDLLKSRWPAIRVLACRSLSELAARDSVPKLVWALEDPDPAVVKAAHQALRRLTRLDLPGEPLAWQEATNTEPRGAEL